MQDILRCLEESRFFSLHLDETTDITVHQHCGIMLRYFDNTEGRVRCIFFKLEPVEKADADGLFQAIHQNFTADTAWRVKDYLKLILSKFFGSPWLHWCLTVQ